MKTFSSRLIAWQHTHGRHDLPWQSAQASDAGVPSPRLLPQSAGFASNVLEADAYRVWLSEIMLQQTQVVTVIPYFQRFIVAFPNITTLAAATEDQVLAHWSGLGYYARGRNLHKAARVIVEKFGGVFPREFEQILELPGIGRSTAAAICALAYHQPRAILDGNVKRVLSRYCGIEGWAGNKNVEARLWQSAESLLPLTGKEGDFVGRDLSRQDVLTVGINPDLHEYDIDSAIATYTQALMDLGATICTRSRPRCVLCPVQQDCVALATDRTKTLPTPRPKKAVPERRAIFLLLMHGNEILLEKRPAQGIWGGLWCLPQFEDEATARDWFEGNGIVASEGKRLKTFTHIFTHFKLSIAPLKIQLAHKPVRVVQSSSVWLNVEEALQAAIPTPVRSLLLELRG